MFSFISLIFSSFFCQYFEFSCGNVCSFLQRLFSSFFVSVSVFLWKFGLPVYRWAFINALEYIAVPRSLPCMSLRPFFSTECFCKTSLCTLQFLNVRAVPYRYWTLFSSRNGPEDVSSY